jgi:hypothetical protein
LTYDDQAIEREARRRFGRSNPGDPRGILANVPIHFQTEPATADVREAVGSFMGAYADKRRKTQEALAAAQGLADAHQRSLEKAKVEAEVKGEQERLTDVQLGDVKNVPEVGYATRKAGATDWAITPVAPQVKRSVVEYRGGRGGAPVEPKLTRYEQSVVSGELLDNDYQAAKSRRWPKPKMTLDSKDKVIRAALPVSRLEQSAIAAADNAVALANPAEARAALDRAEQELVPKGEAWRLGEADPSSASLFGGSRGGKGSAALTYGDIENVRGILDDARAAIKRQEDRLRWIPAAQQQYQQGAVQEDGSAAEIRALVAAGYDPEVARLAVLGE